MPDKFSELSRQIAPDRTVARCQHEDCGNKGRFRVGLFDDDGNVITETISLFCKKHCADHCGVSTEKIGGRSKRQGTVSDHA